MSDDKYMNHYTVRAAGRLYTGPVVRSETGQASVMDITFREMTFADSTSAMRFMDSVGQKQRSRNTACKARAIAQRAAATSE